jgi:hypothetical protein
VSNLLKKILSRWETSPPILNSPECGGRLAPIVARLREQSILRPTTPASAFSCTECGERRSLTYITDDAGKTHGYIHCQCGVSPVAEELLKRWQIDSPALLGAIFGAIRFDLQERVAGLLWQVGKATWVGRAREVWFVRSFVPGEVDLIARALKSRPKAVLFACLEATAIRLQERLPNPILALESTVSWAADGLAFDSTYVEGRLVDLGVGIEPAKGRPTKKRSNRAADIEALTKEMIKHLRAAKQHAKSTEELTGEPELLPRPTQKALGERVDLPEWAVSRCFDDEL